ncbi:MAG TPA: serine hydrolase domain-containing protein [Anaeromyxobacteraceae bacterium]|nr:serine hydrolase domain-containing protein [Anaeromyxobacteraceae bacterium]
MTGPALRGVGETLEAGRREGVAPGLAACVRVRGEVAHRSWHGDAQVMPARRPLTERDLFDVASLTKVMATGSLAALLVAGGAIELDAPARRWLPGLPDDKAAITVRQLLAHASGLPAWRDLAARGGGRGAGVAAAMTEPLEAAPGARAAYSDLGFVLMGALLEAVAGAPLDAQFAARVAGPLGLADTAFAGGVGPGRSFAAARRTPARGVICGQVDDDNAFAMGGVAGHAGLFSTAPDVAALGQAWIDALAGRSAWLPAGVAARFAARDAAPGSSRALAWDTPERGGPSTFGTRLGRGARGAIGHLGFTGCSLWVDLDREVVCALLTNHVHPDGADRSRINAFRARFHDAVAEAVGV